jgi:hypothetical protein
MNSGRLHRALELLARAQGEQLSPLDVTDCLWLARVLAPSDAVRKGSDDPVAERQRTRDAQLPKPRSESPAPSSTAPLTHDTSRSPRQAPLHLQAPSPVGGKSVRATGVGIPVPHAIHDRSAYERALRPFLRRFASGRREMLDPDATAALSAERQFITPVFKPAAERWFDVVLLMEHSEPMAVWKPTARELRSLLARHGAFRNVWLWTVDFYQEEILLTTQQGMRAKAGALSGESCRRIVLVLTHGHGASWRKPSVARWLDEVGKTSVLALVQLLPERTWPFSELGDASDWVSTPLRAPMNRQLVTSRLFGPGCGNEKAASPAIPMLALRPDAVAHWAEFVMVSRNASHPAVTLKERNGHVARSTDVNSRIERFRRSSSTSAFQLLRLLSACPVSLPVMRLMQQAADIDASPSVLAEVLLSGLLLPPPAAPETERTIYDFDEDARKFLFGGLSSNEARLAQEYLAPERERIRKFVESVTGKHYETFFALLQDEDGLEQLPADDRAFASVSRRLYEVRGVLRRETPPPPAGLAVAAPAANPLAVGLIFEDEALDLAVRAPLHKVLTERGHQVVAQEADFFVRITASSDDRTLDADLHLYASTPFHDMVAAIERHVVKGKLHGWPPLPRNWISRPSDIIPLRERLLDLGVRRQGEPLPLISAEANSGARSLLREVCEHDDIRRRFPRGIFFNQDPNAASHVRRGLALVLLVGLKLSTEEQEQRVEVGLAYTPGKLSGALYDIGYVHPTDTLSWLLTHDAPTDAIEFGASFHRHVPLLIPLSLELYAGGRARMPNMGNSVEQRLQWGVNEIVKHLPQGESLAHLVRFAVRRPGCPDVVGVHAPAMALRLAWVMQQDGCTWMVPQIRAAIQPKRGRAFREESDRLVRQLIQSLRGSGPVDDYCARNLIVHAYEAAGIANVAQVLLHPNVEGRWMTWTKPFSEQLSDLTQLDETDAPHFIRMQRTLLEGPDAFFELLHELKSVSGLKKAQAIAMARILISTNATRYDPESDTAVDAVLAEGYMPVRSEMGVRTRRKDAELPDCDAVLLILKESEQSFEPDRVAEHAMQIMSLARKNDVPVMMLVENSPSMSMYSALRPLAQVALIATYWGVRDFDRALAKALVFLRKAMQSRPMRRPIARRRAPIMPTYPTPPLPGPLTNPKDLQSGRWGAKANRHGRKITAHLRDVQQDDFTFDLVVHSVDSTPLQGPVIFHLHDTYTRKIIHIRKIREEGKIAILEKTTAYGVYTVGVQVMTGKGEWTSLEFDLRTLVQDGLPKRFVRR